jgi:hypothetical protein
MDGLMGGIDDKLPNLRGQLGDVTGEISSRIVPPSPEVRRHAVSRSTSPFSPGTPAVHIEHFEATERMSPHEVGERLMFLMRSRGM